MYTKNVFAFGALVALATAVPLQQQKEKRDIVWETETKVDVTTVAVTTTVWLEPGETPPAHYGHGGHGGHGRPHETRTSHIKSTLTVSPPADTPEPSEAAPAQTSQAYTPPAPSAPPAETQAPAPEQPAPKPEQPAPKPGHGGSSSGSNGLTGLAASGKSYTGDLTWYETGLGACGITSSSSDHIVAISESLFDAYGTANPNENPLCDQTVSIVGADGSTYDAKIVDRCTGCAMSDLDLSQDFFNLVTNNGDGRVGGMSWSFV